MPFWLLVLLTNTNNIEREFMTTKHLAIAVTTLALATLGTSALAQNAYIVGAIGSSIPANNIKTDTDALLRSYGATNLQSSLGNGTAMRFAAGYQVNPNFGIEGGYVDTGTMSYTATATGATISSDVKGTGFQFALVGTAPINDSFAAFGKVGYTALSMKSNARINTTSVSLTEDKNSGGFGFGAKYKLSEKLWLRGEWERVSSDVSAITFGLQANF